MRKLLLLLVMVLGMVSLASAQENETDDGTVIIGPSQIGVVFDPASGDLLDPLGPGTHEVLPPLTVTIYSTAQQSFTLTGQMDMNGVRGDEAVNARTLDGQEIFADATLFFSVDPNRVNDLHIRWDDRYVIEFVLPTLRATISDVIAQYPAELLYGQDRVQVEAQIGDELAQALDQENLLYSDFLLRQVTFSEAFSDAIGERLVAEQEVNAARIQSDLAIIEAEAEATVLEILSPLIQDNPLLIYVLYIRALEHGGDVPDELFFELGLDEGMLSIPEVGD